MRTLLKTAAATRPDVVCAPATPLASATAKTETRKTEQNTYLPPTFGNDNSSRVPCFARASAVHARIVLLRRLKSGS